MQHRIHEPVQAGDQLRHNRTRQLAGWGALAAGLSALAVYNARAARRAEAKHPPRGKFVEVDGVRLHYRETGDGTPVVLIHGNLVDGDDWVRNGLFDQIAANGHRVIAFDRPGFGHSTRPRGVVWTMQRQAGLILDAAAALGADRPVLVGHSIGATVALAAALERPEAVRGVVLISGYYFWTVRADVPPVAPLAVPGIGDVLRYTSGPVAARALWSAAAKLIFSPERPQDGFNDATRALGSRPSQLRATAADALLLGPSVAQMAPRYASVTAQARVLGGADDKLIGTDTHSERLAGILSNAQLVRAPGAGHMLPYAQPATVAAAVEAVAAAVL
jgi:pimeloyl-ACP methyl ester carboxylesterase